MKPNYLPVVGSFLKRLQEAGITLVAAADMNLEGTDRQRRQEAKRIICGYDRTFLTVLCRESINRVILLQTNRGPENLVHTYSLSPEIEAVVTNHVAAWRGRSAPTKP